MHYTQRAPLVKQNSTSAEVMAQPAMEPEISVISDSSGSEDSDFSSDDESIPAVLPPTVLAALNSGTAYQTQQHNSNQQSVTRSEDHSDLDDDGGPHFSSDDEQPGPDEGLPAPIAVESTALSGSEHQSRAIYNHETVTAEDGTSETMYRVFWQDQPPTWEPASAVSAEELEKYVNKSPPHWDRYYRATHIANRSEVILGDGKVETWFWCRFQPRAGRQPQGSGHKHPTWLRIGEIPPEVLERYLLKIASEGAGKAAQEKPRKPPVPVNQLPFPTNSKSSFLQVIEGHTDNVLPDGTIERWFRVKGKKKKSLMGKAPRNWKLGKDLPQSLVARYFAGNKVHVFASKPNPSGPRSGLKKPSKKKRQVDDQGRTDDRHWAVKLKDDAKSSKTKLQDEIKKAQAREKTRDTQIQALQKELDYQLRLRDAYLSRNEESNVRALESELHKVRWQLETRPRSDGQVNLGEPNVQALEAEIANLRWQLSSQPWPTQFQAPAANVQALEAEIQNLRWQLDSRPQSHSQITNVQASEAAAQISQWRLDTHHQFQSQFPSAHVLEAEINKLQWQLVHQPTDVPAILAEIRKLQWQLDSQQRVPQAELHPGRVHALERQVQDLQQGQMAQRDAFERQIRDLQGQLAQRDTTITKLSALYGKSGTMYALNALETTQETSTYGTTPRSYYLEPVPRAGAEGLADTSQYLTALRQ